jgi:hypothetical protein
MMVTVDRGGLMALAADYLERAAGLSARPAAVQPQQQIQVKMLDHAAHSADKASACCRTFCTAASCKSGG